MTAEQRQPVAPEGLVCPGGHDSGARFDCGYGWWECQACAFPLVEADDPPATARAVDGADTEETP